MSYEKDIPEYAMMPARAAGAVEAAAQVEDKEAVEVLAALEQYAIPETSTASGTFADEQYAISESVAIKEVSAPAAFIDAHKKKEARGNLEPLTKSAMYMPTRITNISHPPKLVITVEEDILVPDVKPDLAEILMVDGTVHLSTREILHSAKVDEYTNLSGEIDLQILYRPEKAEGCNVVPIEAKLLFKEQWLAKAESTITLDCCIDKIDYMVINERKLRAKVSLSLKATEYCDNEVSLFEGLVQDSLERRRETVEFSAVALRTKDPFAISEDILPNDDFAVDQIICQSINVIENYKQVTGDKVVINGFVCVNLLYSVKSPTDDVNCVYLHQLQEKVEFTQFVPVQVGSNISHCDITFDSNQLKVRVAQNEDGRTVFRLDGTLISYIEIYRNAQKDIIVDAYHKEKNFVCDFEEANSHCVVGCATGDTTVREIFSPKANCEVEQILYTYCHVSKCESRIEHGKIITEGSLTAEMLCMENADCHKVLTVSQEIPFRVATAMVGLFGDEFIDHKVCLKDYWAEKINGKQLEFNCTVVVTACAVRNNTIPLLTNPSFEICCGDEQTCPMVIYSCKESDSLWQIAKKFKTTVDSIMSVNNMESETIHCGGKLLIIR